MIKEKNFIFLENLIDFNFIFLDSHISKTSSFDKVQFSNQFLNKTFKIIDPLILIKMLKQCSRLLRYLKYKKKSKLFLHFDNIYFSKLLEILLKQQKIDTSGLKVQSKLKNINNSINNRLNCIFLSRRYSDIKLKNSFFSKNIFLINEINDFSEFNNLGTYKVYNNINDLKKFIFLFLFIKHFYLQIDKKV